MIKTHKCPVHGENGFDQEKENNSMKKRKPLYLQGKLHIFQQIQGFEKVEIMGLEPTAS